MTHVVETLDTKIFFRHITTVVQLPQTFSSIYRLNSESEDYQIHVEI